MFISVDLPAPFSPSSACTSPLRRSKSTWSFARTPGKRFVIPRSSRTGVSVVFTSGRSLRRRGGGGSVDPPPLLRACAQCLRLGRHLELAGDDLGAVLGDRLEV